MAHLAACAIQVLLTLHPGGVAPLRFGFPLPEKALARGLRVTGASGARLQWRRLQPRADPDTGRVWVELCVTGRASRLDVRAGGAAATVPERGMVVRRTRQVRIEAGRRRQTVRWRWRHSGEVDETVYIGFLQRQIHSSGEVFGAGEGLTEGGAPQRFSTVGIRATAWRRAGVLPAGGRLGREYRARLAELVPRLKELTGLRGRGDYGRSRDVVTNLEFDTTLGLVRLGLATGNPAVLERARRSALHLVDRDLDSRTGLLFRHAKGHRSGAPDPGHTWLSGLLLLGCVAADERLIGAARLIARGLARHPAPGQGEDDRVRDVGWPLLEMETWLRFEDDPEVAAACRRLVHDMLRRWDPGAKVFRFGEGGGARRTYEEPLWVTSGSLLRGLAAHHRRSRSARVAGVLRDLRGRLRKLLLAGRRGLPLRCWVRGGRVVSASRQAGTPAGFMLLDGLAPADLRRCLSRRQVRRALLEVPGADDPDLATSWSIVARCWWIYL